MQLLLASQSPYRRAQLEAFGLVFSTEKPLVNEEELKKEGPNDLVELTRFLAEKKALSLVSRFPEAVILGSDQIVEFDGQRLDKPLTFAAAVEQLKRLAGKKHRLITSLVMFHKGRTLQFTDITTLHLKRLSDERIAAYVRLDSPLDCAGSYKIEKAGLGLVEELETKDPSAIQGLPILSLVRGLDELGIPLERLWRQK
jgi:septum formation protein